MIYLLASRIGRAPKGSHSHLHYTTLSRVLSVGLPELLGAGCPNISMPMRGHALDEVVVLRLILVVVLAGLVLVLKLVEVLVEVLQCQAHEHIRD